MRTQSLSFRLLLTEGLVLAAFFALVAVVLEQSFRESAEQALKERLQVQIYSLISTAELKNSGELNISSNLQEPRFANPGSGLYAFIQQPKKTSFGVHPHQLALMCQRPLKNWAQVIPIFFTMTADAIIYITISSGKILRE